MISPRWGGQSSCDASPSASWKVSRKGATPMHMSSSAASAVTIPTWITAISPPNFSGSAGRTSSRTASRHTGSTSGVGTGSGQFPRQPKRADQNDPRTLWQIFRDRPELAESCDGRSLLPADRGGHGPVHGRAGGRAARGSRYVYISVCLLTVALPPLIAWSAGATRADLGLGRTDVRAGLGYGAGAFGTAVAVVSAVLDLAARGSEDGRYAAPRCACSGTAVDEVVRRRATPGWGGGHHTGVADRHDCNCDKLRRPARRRG